jgi:RNA polymerase sigma-70 factor (ECF subfamily)
LNSLAAACRRGDEASARPLVEALTRPLVAAAWRYTRDWEAARDLAQETWMKAFARLDDYDTARPFRTWLFAIHRNGCFDHLRSARVRHEVLPGDAAIRTRLATGVDVPADARLRRRELRDLLLRAAGTLSAAQRDAFFRVDVEGGEPKRVAEEMGIAHGTLRATLHAARKRVAAALRETREEAS